MPTYEYECDACDNRFEEFQSMLDKPLKKCPKCKKQKLRRLFGTGSAILFKGSGFYETDYRSDNYQKGAKAEKESSEKPAASKDSTTEKKGESTPAPGTPSQPSKGKKKD